MTILFGVRPLSKQWWTLRREGIGGSEIAGLFGEEKPTYGKGAWALFHEKGQTGIEIPDESSDRADIGRWIEGGIITAASKKERLNCRRTAYAICDDEPRVRASLDAVAQKLPASMADHWTAAGISGWGAVEAMFDDFGWDPQNPDRPTPPRRMLLQLQHGMLAAGLQWGVLAVLFEGDNLQLYFAKADAELHADIRSRVAGLYRRIERNDPPPADANQVTKRALKKAWSVSSGTHLKVPAEAAEEFDELCAMKAAFDTSRLDSEKQATLYDNRIRDLLKDHETAEGRDWQCSLKPDRNGNRYRLRVSERKREAAHA
jgi:predicted phage-related endonuclease